MGCGHFVATLKREVFDKGTNEPAFIKIQGGVENKFIDIPNERLGLLRLATKLNYAFHMGNFSEPWMYEEFNNIHKESSSGIDITKLRYKNFNKNATFLGRVFIKFLKKQKVKNIIFKKLGLANPLDYDI